MTAIRHGHALSSGRSPTYEVWKGMRDRCYRKTASQYFRYGARGIRVCERWMTFENFLADMGERPENKTLGRIDNEGNYSPKNCRWESQQEQDRNKRNSILLERDGEILCLAQWERKLGLSQSTLYHRYKEGRPMPTGLRLLTEQEKRHAFK